MRLIDADELIEHAWRDRLDSRELIAEMIENAPTIVTADSDADIRIKRMTDCHYEYGVFQCGLHCVGKFSTKREADIVCEAFNKNIGRPEYIVMQRLVMAWEGVPENG